jgi:DNA helicase-2/ATP-dependent DNA helicase PcrA
LTIGVLSRVLELADRETPGPKLPDWHILPLIELLGQALGQGAKTRAVTAAYDKLLNFWSSEFEILMETPIEELREEAGSLVALGVERMRAGDVTARGGYDGLYGTIEVLSERDRDEAHGQGFLFPTQPRRGRPAGSTARPKAQAPRDSQPAVVRRKKEPQGILADLSLEQKAAVTAEAPSLAVVAGPGAGKTLVLVRRAAFQSRRLSLPSERLLLTTYTKKAAETLAERLADPSLALVFPEKATVKTLHALAYGLAKQAWPDWELAPPEFVEKILKTQAAGQNISPARLGLAIGHFKNAGRFPKGSDHETLEGLAQGYQAALAENRLWDYDDLIITALKEPPGEWGLVLADELQDFSALQLDFLLRQAQRAPLTVIGDPDQSVYGFRGARAEIFADLAFKRPELTTMELTGNYRSNAHICQLAEVARPSPRGDGPPRRCVFPGPSRKIARLTFPDSRQEARFVAHRLRESLGVLDLGQDGRASRERDAIPNLSLGETAIVFRWRSQAQEIAHALDEEGLAWQLAGEEEVTAADGLDFKADKVSLLTIHAAKGLEFRLVFLVGLEEGLFPEIRDNGREPLDEREEARLFYVALTRARERLYLTRAMKRRHFGRLLSGQPSPFWSLLDRYCLDRHIARSREKTASLF